MTETEHVCGSCGQHLQLVEPVYLLEIVLPIRNNDDGTVDTKPVLDNKGDYAYDPFFFHKHCWANLWDDFESLIEDFPAMDAPQAGKHVGECDACSSDILHMETSGLLTAGELHKSQKDPDGQGTIHFQPYAGSIPDIICIACLHYMNEEQLEMWPSITLAGICERGLYARCWREGTCANGCQFRKESK